MLSKLALIRTSALVCALLSPLAFAASPASAAPRLTFVSGKGTDSGNCANPANPCRTFDFALGKTRAAGEIKALDPANYGPIVIRQSVTITGVEGASINITNGVGIKVLAGASDVVNISNLAFEGNKKAQRGLVVRRVGSLNVKNCLFRNFASDGIFIEPPSGTTFFRLTDVESSDNGVYGIYFNAKNMAVTNGVLDRVKLHHNNSGLYANRSSNDATLNLVVNASQATNNTNIGFLSGAQGTFALHNSVSTGNAYGLYVNTQMGSTGGNLVYGNTTANSAGSTFAIAPQ
jgi:hypothetical protein